jgi:N-acetyl-anhydromuramyl-L-alanine amidase AmpD
LLEVFPVVTAALLSGIGRDASWCCGHREWAPNRKIDPTGIDMDDFRRDVQTLLAGGSLQPAGGGTTGAPGSSTGAVLGRGDRGDDVAAWQQQLNGIGFTLVVDGDFGPATEAATRSFQRDAGLVADGIVGPRTRAAMAALLVPSP